MGNRIAAVVGKILTGVLLVALPLIALAQGKPSATVTGVTATASGVRVAARIHHPVEAGEMVSVIPLGVPLAAVQVPIESVAAGETCTDQDPPFWIATLAVIDSPAYMSVEGPAERAADQPFDAVVLSPARRQAHRVATPAALPRGVRATAVLAAISVDSDDSAELLLTQFCCTQPAAGQRCESNVCGRDYWRKSGRWIELRRWSPC
jgi:hypothetical protein